VADGDAAPLGFRVVELTVEEALVLRERVLRAGMPGTPAAFAEDALDGVVHLGVRTSPPPGDVVATSTWIPRPFHGEPAVQLRGMATDAAVRGRGLGALLIDAGCTRAAAAVGLVWANARDAALAFYRREGFEVVGDGFVDPVTQLPHHVVVRRLRD